MNTFAPASSLSRRQRGAASVAIVMLLVFILAAAVLAVMRISGSSVSDAAMNEQQTSVLTLAESGLERAQATIAAAARSGSYTSATCTGLNGVTSSLGRGSFKYSSAVYNVATGDCAVTVQGMIGNSSTGDSSRSVSATLSVVTSAQGVEGNGSAIALNMNTASPNAGVVTNLAFPSGGTASVGSCTNPGSCSNVLNVVSGGSQKLSNTDVYAGVATAGAYTIKETLVDSGNNPVSRNYVQVGAVFYPASGSVSYVGAYGANSGSSKTAATSTASSGGSVPSGWNCAPNSGTSTASNAAGADTLVYGFSSMAATANQVNGVTFGVQPLTKIRDMTGTQGDNLYSQIWYAHNPAYISPTGATNGADFTGTMGATFTGHTSGTMMNQGSNVTLYLDSDLGSNEILSVGDTISGWSGCTSCTMTIISGTCTTAGSNTSGTTCQVDYTGTGTCGMCVMMNNCTGVSMIAKSNVLHVVSINTPNYAVLTSGATGTGDTINVTGTPTVLSQSSGTTGKAGKYSISGSQLYVASSAMQSSGTTITLSGATATPSAGTAIAISSGTGDFDSAKVTGSISGTTLTVTAVASGTLHNGDALFGGKIGPNTHITGGPVAGGTGTYTVDNSQTAAGGAIVARAAVLSTTNANSYVASRQPTTRLSNSAQVCGGVCAFLNNDGTSTPFTLTNITNTADWSSGFTCLKNVDDSKVNTTGQAVVSQRSKWSEAVK
jgi:hypothetical protein